MTTSISNEYPFIIRKQLGAKAPFRFDDFGNQPMAHSKMERTWKIKTSFCAFYFYDDFGNQPEAHSKMERTSKIIKSFFTFHFQEFKRLRFESYTDLH